MGIFIPTSKLENLKLYKYQSEDHSIVSKYILKRWWNNFVQIFPMSMAPNVITLLGLCFIIVNVLTVFYYDPFLNTPSPRWVYFSYAFGLFMYQTFDGCDGAHARRTGQSGPLGELFDHCIDAINTTLATIIFASVTQMGYGPMLILSQFGTVCNFYISTWEEYHTNILYLSEFSGPVEGILMIVGLYIVTGIVGPQFWTKLSYEIDLSSIGLSSNFEITSSFIYLALGIPSIYFNVHQAKKNVDKALSGDNSKQLSALKGLLPFTIYYISVIIICFTNPLIMYKYCLPLVLSIGSTIAFSVGRIILAHLTVQEFPMVNAPMFIPLAQMFVIFFFELVYGYNDEHVTGAVMWTGFGLTAGIHSMFIADIILEITTYLDIYALSIKHKRA